MHQPIDDCCGQGIVGVEDLAPFAEDLTGRDDLEHQISSPLVDGVGSKY